MSKRTAAVVYITAIILLAYSYFTAPAKLDLFKRIFVQVNKKLHF